MNTGTPPRAADGARLGTALTRRAALNAATRAYLRSDAVDMSALAAQLGIGRSTLYRLVGNRDDLLEVVLAEATERTFRRTAAAATAEGASTHVRIDELLAEVARSSSIHRDQLATEPRTPRQVAESLLTSAGRGEAR
jgi:AcrR family transcriptional regulator